MYRYIVLVAAVLMQMCLGATYSWSAFVSRVREISDISQGNAQIPFTLFYIVFPATTIVGGMLLSRLTPRMCAIAGGILFGGGWVLAGFGDRSFAFTVVGIGVLGGIGVGLAYLVPIAMGVLWFPRHKGLVTGISVGGFAAGAAVVAGVADRLVSWSPFEVFRLCGIAFWEVIPLAGLLMKRPRWSVDVCAAGRVADGPAPAWLRELDISRCLAAPDWQLLRMLQAQTDLAVLETRRHLHLRLKSSKRTNLE